ncbi:SDR family NAD(P)-dependent oxidoreductase [Amycolatopsis alkalitolerans]|nr:SDR family oxidoreductase [Amycolatopsis alkalitolerans]
MEIDGAVAVVTGGTGAIGQSVIALLAKHGARPVAWDLYVEGGQDGVISCDVGSAESVEAAMEQTVARWGVPAILVTVAAVSGGFSPLATSATGTEWDEVFTAPETWERVLRTNVVGVANCMRSFARRLSDARRPGSVVNVSSISSGPVAEPGLAAYSASKAALNQLTRVAAAELGPLGIRVNAVGPGLMETPMRGPSRPNAGVTKKSDARPAEFASEIVKHVPIEQRHGRGEDIAQAVAAMLQTDWVTGQIVYADGGLTLRSPVTT